MKKKKLFEVSIYGRKCPVYMIDGLTGLAENYGEFREANFEIFIDADICLPMFIHTLAHEMFHATKARLNLQISDEREEEYCEQFLKPLIEELDILPKTPHLQKFLKFQASRTT